MKVTENTICFKNFMSVLSNNPFLCIKFSNNYFIIPLMGSAFLYYKTYTAPSNHSNIQKFKKVLLPSEIANKQFLLVQYTFLNEILVNKENHLYLHISISIFALSLDLNDSMLLDQNIYFQKILHLEIKKCCKFGTLPKDVRSFYDIVQSWKRIIEFAIF